MKAWILACIYGTVATMTDSPATAGTETIMKWNTRAPAQNNITDANRIIIIVQLR